MKGLERYLKETDELEKKLEEEQWKRMKMDVYHSPVIKELPPPPTPVVEELPPPLPTPVSTKTVASPKSGLKKYVE